MSPPLVDRVAPLAVELTRFARWLASATHDADDVVQETLIRALRARDVPPSERALRAWLFRIARNVHVDQRRAQAARDRFVVLEGGRDDLEELEEPVTTTAHDIDRTDLERALAELPEGTRAALVLTDVWEFDHAEVAAILDVPVGTVKSRVARGRARLAAILASDVQPHAERRGR
jgi:RNA polymerase sigma-70 factor (ECF subfamily)